MHTHIHALGRKAMLVGIVALLAALPARTADAAWSRGVRGWWVGFDGAVCRDGATVSWVWADTQNYDHEKSTFRLWQADAPGAGAFLGYVSMQADTYLQPVVVISATNPAVTSTHTSYAIRDVFWPAELPVGTPITVEDLQANDTPRPTTTTALVEDCLLRQRQAISTPVLGTHIISPTDFRSQALAIPDYQLRYRVESLPAHGTLKLITTTLAVGSSFTQADINNGRLSYIHSGDEVGVDSFGYSVSGMQRIAPEDLLNPDPDTASFNPKISANGGVIAFASDASNWIPSADNNFTSDIFKWFSNGQTLRLSNNYDGNAPNNPSVSPAISADGAVVAFASSDLNLALSGDCAVDGVDPGEHIFSAQETLYAFSTDQQLHRRSISSGSLANCRQGNGVSYAPTVSSDGTVLFLSAADNLLLPAADPDGSISDVFAHSPMSVTSILSARAITTAYSGAASVAVGGAGDGELIAFGASDEFVAGDTNNAEDIFARTVRGPKAGQTLHISKPLTQTQTNGDSREPAVSRNGRWVAFSSFANNLVVGDSNNRQDIFLRDVIGNTTVRVSVGLTGTQSNGDSSEPVVSADGRYVAFSSTASNLTLDDTDADSDVFVRDMQTGQTTLVSKSLTGQPNGASSQPSISDDGHTIAFRSTATNLTSYDGNIAIADIYVRYIGYTSTLNINIGTKLVFMPFVQR